MISSLFASLLALTTVQTADDFKAQCEAFQAEYGGESDCGCLAEKVAADDDLAAMMAEITTPEDLADAPAEVLEAIEECTD